MASGSFMLGMADEKDGASGFEFTRRKLWPNLLLHELVGATLFCIRPVMPMNSDGRQSGGHWQWMIAYAAPSAYDMIGKRPADLEGSDFFHLIHPSDCQHLSVLFTNLLFPTPPESNSSTPLTNLSPSLSHRNQGMVNTDATKSRITYARMTDSFGRSPTWELSLHATGLDSGQPKGFGPGGPGTVVPGLAGAARALWVMGRKVEASPEGEAKSLESLLELKLENENLRSDLLELRLDMDDDYWSRSLESAAFNQNASDSASSSSSPSSSISPSASPAPRSSKQSRALKRKRTSVVVQPTGGVIPSIAEGMHVCVTCGRTDSPEWRKGPLGPKTLCNACGLRWAKRNANGPGKKDNKDSKMRVVPKSTL